ncbi:hypothetical protein JMUB7547_28430 [Staphylococcus aureus]
MSASLVGSEMCIRDSGNSPSIDFKQKTAYEMSASLVGSEMCIRDRGICVCVIAFVWRGFGSVSYTHLTLPTKLEV